MIEDKLFIISEMQRQEIIHFFISRNFLAGKNTLMQLKSLEEYLKEEELKKTGGKDGTFEQGKKGV